MARPHPPPARELDDWHSRRERLLAAACRETARRGVERLTLASVADEAGVSKGAVQYAFGSRDEMLAALARWTLSGIYSDGVGASLAGRSDLTEIIDGLSRGLASDEARLLTVVSLMSIAQRNPPVYRALESFYAGADERIEAGLRRNFLGQPVGAALPTLVRGVRGVVIGMFFHWTVHPQGRDLDDVSAEVRHVLAQLLAPPRLPQ